MCEAEGGNHNSLTPNLSADNDKRDQQDNEAEMADEERFSGDRDRDTPPLPYSIKSGLCLLRERRLIWIVLSNVVTFRPLLS